ncbi:phospholipase A1 member A isoform X4 [Nelusetta ayraudi]|uniref:phospholipase A1 member A isoform X4 n=1 Tax=Nelusetta ayraudi TaxID=303726 RepID=UPI003F6ECA1E
MPREYKAILLLALTACVASLAVAAEGQKRDEECAELSNTTWREYRQHGAKLRVQYLLLTRKNEDCAQAFTHQSVADSQQASNFVASRPTKVIIHGYRALGSTPSWAKDLAQALLRVQDVNVLVVDWIYSASFAYNVVVQSYKEVAVEISVLISQLQKQGCKLEDFHLIGISLGAHVAGFVGTLFEGKIGRITDFGISIPIGHVDFFLNGGQDQTGCARSRFASMYGYVICDHMRALHVYMSALNASCPLLGIPCSSFDDFLRGRCRDCNAFGGECPTIGLSKNSGITVSPLPREQKLFLLTSSSQPFCARHFLLHLEVSPLDKSAELEVALKTDNAGKGQRFRLQTGTTVYRMVLSHPVMLCEIHSIELKNTGSRFYRQFNVHVKTVCLSEFPTPRGERPLCVNNFNVRRGAPWSHDFVQVCDF